MKILDELKYTKTHEWARIEGDIVTCGITDYAQSELSDVVFVNLPKLGISVNKSKPLGTIEAVKAVSDIYALVSGEIVEVNERLANSPDLVNRDPYGEGWMVKIKISNQSELDALLTAEDYKKTLPSS